MFKCERCGKELKNGQGLAGHMRLAHGGLPPALSRRVVPLEELGKLEEERLQRIASGLDRAVASLQSIEKNLEVINAKLDSSKGR